MTKPVISGVAIDTLLLSRIGIPLFHHYRIISRVGTHAALHGTYMRQLHGFLKEMDEEAVRQQHRWRAQEMAARMSLPSVRDSAKGTADVSTRRTVARRTVSGPNDLASQCGGPGLLILRTWFPCLRQKHTWSKR